MSAVLTVWNFGHRDVIGGVSFLSIHLYLLSYEESEPDLFMFVGIT